MEGSEKFRFPSPKTFVIQIVDSKQIDSGSVDCKF